MERSDLRPVRSIVAIGLCCALSSCQVGAEDDLAARSQAASVHRSGHPPHWTRWTTDGEAAVETGDGFLVGGLRCGGRYCDDVGLLAVETGHAHLTSWWTGYFSEEGQNYRVCEDGGFVTGLHCTGRYCDDLNLRCTRIDNGGVRDGCYWTSHVSEEDGGRFVAPGPAYVAGVSCNGRYCDNLNLLMCQATPAAGAEPAALAAKFAPRLRFDQETTTGSGQSSKCFPSDPGVYFAARAAGASPQSLCNKDYASVASHQVPTYYIASSLGGGAVIIRYWFFYAWQSTCFGGLGDHAADWESMAVLLVDGQLTRVAYWQHGGWYSRERGQLQLVDGSHPVGYVGKNSHGTYHDDGGSGGCLYFEDYRNPGGADYHMDTWHHLVELGRGGDRPAWMNCQGSGCFDGIGHPIEQSGDLRSLGGCGKDGCGRSSVGGNRPFVDDPTGVEHATIAAQHSGRAIDVPGASTANGVALTQYASWHVDNQRWLLESTGDGYFTLRARHSGKCMDVSGASSGHGAPLIQHACNGGANQRFRLLSHGDGTFAVQAGHSGQCLDIAGWSMDDGGALIQWPCAWTANQRFAFAP
jgi:hypothetical protein